MKKNLSAVRLGLFIFLGTVLLVLAVFLIGQKNALFSSTFNVKAYFKDVQGLRSGATVRLSGIDVGSVSGVQILNDTTGRVEVSMGLQTDIEKFIRTDTKATIETEGLVGNKVVVLKMGTSSAEPIKEGGVVQSQEPVSFSAIIAQTEGIMQYTKNMTKDLSEIIGGVNRGDGSIGKLFKDDELYNSATNLTERADKSLKDITDELNRVTGLFDRLGIGVENVVNNVNRSVTNLDTIIAGIREGRGVMGKLIVGGSEYDSTFAATLLNVNKTSQDARLAASRLAENMEALKHNWLFKNYFENRGYWDKAEYQDILDAKVKEIDQKIRILDKRINQLRELQNKSK